MRGLQDGAAVVDAAASRALQPEPVLTVSQWADRFRYLSQAASSEAGLWRTSRVPYMAEIMDALSARSPVQQVSFQKGAQIGGTEALLNWIGYIVDYAPGPALVVQPTKEMAADFSRQRLDPLFDSPRLREKIAAPRSRDATNTERMKTFDGGVLRLVGANAPAPLRSMPVRFLMLDELDGYPGQVGGEGDPAYLAEQRTRNFPRSKTARVSTPTIDGRSRIQTAFRSGDQSYYYVPCPDCGHMQRIVWSNIVYEKDEHGDLVPGSVFLRCEDESCAILIREHHKTWMLQHGEWRAERPDRSGRHRSFHLSALYSPLGWYSWEVAAEEWIAAQDDTEKLRGFVNTVFGEAYREKGEAPPWETLYLRRETYPIGTVPQGGLLLTAGADVQANRIEVEVVAWGPGKESWSIGYYVFPGDTGAIGNEPWRELGKLLTKRWPMAGLDAEVGLSKLAVDCGYARQIVYQWVYGHSNQLVLAVQGRSGMRPIISTPKAQQVTKSGKVHRRGIQLWTVGADAAKTELYGWLRQEPPLHPDRDGWPSGWCHHPEYEEEYFRQLTAEELRMSIRQGQRTYKWDVVRPNNRNEALDCRVYARAAAAVAGIDRWDMTHWEQLAASLGAGDPRPTRPRRRKRRRGGWLQR